MAVLKEISLTELFQQIKDILPKELAKDEDGIEKDRFENAKKGKREDKLFIYEMIKRIIEMNYKNEVNSQTIDKLIREHYVNYYENLYFEQGKDKDIDFDDFDLSVFSGKTDPDTLEVFRTCKEKLRFKPSEDADIIAVFERYKLTADSLYSDKLDRLARIIYQSVWGFGPIEDFIDQNDIFNDIGCNRRNYIWMQICGKKRPIPKLKFKDQRDYRRVLQNIARYNGAGDINSANPVMECSIMDMQRVTILVPPIVREECEVLRVRNQAITHITLEELVLRGSISKEFYHFLHLILPGRPNIGIYGGQGIGKTTITNAIIEALPYNWAQATQESSHELFADMRNPLKNIIGLQSIAGYGPGEIYKEKLRMCLDNDHYGEIRTSEDAYWAKQTFTRQCRGSLFTVHYSDPYSCIEGIAELVCTHLNFHDHRSMRYSVAKMLNFLIAPHKDSKTGKFYIKSVYEVAIVDRENMKYEIRKIFKYDTEKGKLLPVAPLTQYTKDLLQDYDVTDADLNAIDELFGDCP